jgi:AcrR family transcriptional regulator
MPKGRCFMKNMKDSIIKESIGLFLRKGFKGTSIQHITDAIGVTKGAFYWHFKSKEELLETIIDKYDEEFLEKLYDHMKDFRGNFLKKFREYHRYINEYAKDNGEFCVLFVTLAAEIAGSNNPAESRIKGVYKKYLHFIESLLGLGKQEGFFSEDYSTTLNAHIVIAIHSGILLHWYMNRANIDGPIFAKTYRDIILYGMVAENKRQEIQ